MNPIDQTIAHIAPKIARNTNPYGDLHWFAVCAVNYLAGLLGSDTVTGRELGRLLDSIGALVFARQVEISDQRWVA